MKSGRFCSKLRTTRSVLTDIEANFEVDDVLDFSRTNSVVCVLFNHN